MGWEVWPVQWFKGTSTRGETKQWSLHWRSVKDSRTRFTGEHISPRGNEGRVHKSVAGKGKTNNRCWCYQLWGPVTQPKRDMRKRHCQYPEKVVWLLVGVNNITTTQNKRPCLQPAICWYQCWAGEAVLCFGSCYSHCSACPLLPCTGRLSSRFLLLLVRPSPALDILLDNTVGPDLLYPALYLWSLNF